MAAMRRVEVLKSQLRSCHWGSRKCSGTISGIHASIAGCVGRTPLVRLNRITQGANASVAVKLECENPGKSVKDRLAFALIRDAERAGIISPESTTLVEATSGNTGISLAMLAASKGYRVALTMPETMSLERQVVLRSFGAEIVLTPGSKGMSGAKSRAEHIVQAINSSTSETGEQAFLTSQFETISNARIHRETTGPELWKDTGGNVDVVVMGVGTGGTITGVAQYFRSKGSKCKFVAVEPAESPAISKHLANEPFAPQPHKIQGIGAGFIPKVLELDCVTEVFPVSSADALRTARRLPKEEGILGGISAGAIVHAADKISRRDDMKGKQIVAFIPSHTERYLSSALYSDLTKECKSLPVTPQSSFPPNLPPPEPSAIRAAGGYACRREGIRRDITECIGCTPLVQMNRIAKGHSATIALKLEGENPGKSVKDRLALAMIHDAEAAGLIEPGVTTLVESTSGNTGVAISMIAAARGYRVILTMPEDLSMERRVVMRSLGADIVLTPKALGITGAMYEARRIVDRLEKEGECVPDRRAQRTFLVNQFATPSNAKVHYETTGPEIWNDTDGKVDIVVLGVGSGGTLTGVARYLKEQNPKVRVVAVEPVEAPAISRHRTGQSFTARPHSIQGLGAGFVPPILDTSLVDEVITVGSATAGETARRLALEEGIFAGISTGASVYAALQVAGRADNAGKLIVTLAMSIGERYLSHPYLQPTVEECRNLPVYSQGAALKKPPTGAQLWELLKEEAQRASQREPRLQGWFNASILDQPSFGGALADLVSPALTTQKARGVDLPKACASILNSNRKIMDDCAVDCWRYAQIDAALQESAEPHLPPFLFYKGFHAMIIHRIAHHQWTEGNEWMALLLQSASSSAYGVDIHPGARVGAGVTLDHATGLVIGGTATVGRNVQFLHNITLGATGKHGGDRHPKIGDDCVLGAHCQILGNIRIGDGVVVAASAVVNKPIPDGFTVAGVPAKVVKHSPVADLALFYDTGI
eukprot:TRINITY_DN35897_c0_g1_i1.p1 TRINITY_DN35897_c0_g1~~TRINITY_DN35897_c0_g1_i1.p1  ORF type:complete len:1015 (+),score=231.33 TRINITY_DN35897_c0_g1_i1:59-3046(+)